MSSASDQLCRTGQATGRRVSSRKRLGSTLTPGPIVGGQRDPLEVAALGRGRLGPLQLVDHGAEVGDQRVGVEAHLADRHVHVAVAVGAVLDLAALELADGLADVGGDGAGLRVRHQAAGAERAAEPADQRHEVGRGDGDVEVEHPALDLGDEVVGTDDVGARGAGLGGGVARRRTPRRARPCRCPTAARRCRAPSGRPCGDRRRGAPRARWSRRTSPSPCVFARSIASAGVQCIAVERAVASAYFLPCRHVAPSSLVSRDPPARCSGGMAD